MSAKHDENSKPNLSSSSTAMGKKKTIEEIYTKKTQLEHILLRPDTYVGSIDKQTISMWVLDAATKTMVFRPCTFVPGLYKIFDEIIVNAADNKQRDSKMTKIDVTIDSASNTIRVWNNGSGIPVAIHQEHNIYVAELIFGNLLTGSNFDDDEQKTTGGRNGYGAKLANIFSTEFTVETFDSSNSLSFKQTFTNNMSIRSEPIIKKATGTDFTCITFKPDLRRFKMDELDEDIMALMCKRVYDIAGTNNGSSKINVSLNGSKLDIKSLGSYLEIYNGLEAPLSFSHVGERWEIGIGASDGSFQQVSFVNSICTMKGGQHVNYIADQIVARLTMVLKKKNKGAEIKPNQIKNHLAIYVNARIVNPAFDSQTKEYLTTKITAFGSVCVVPEKMLKEVEKSSIVDRILDWAKFKQNAELKKKGGSKQSRVMGIPKLDDANSAGTAKSQDCTLILTEGDSAKALAISGLGVVGRDYYGVFPLKGKLLNVREASHAQIMKNEEIQNIAKILGLTFGKVYDSCSSLRYGHLMIMTDQDHDGSHIKGLLINFLHHFWPSLLQVPGFLQQFITPIVKCSKGKSEETFFTIPEYLTWKTSKNEGKGWKIKYYKGLGTSTSAEAKEYFSHLETHEIDFSWDERAGDQIDMAFSKKRVDDRKQWLLGMKPGCFIDYGVSSITYDDFINHELILFSHADNERSLPHFMDGFKPSQRKVLFSCFKRNLKREIKVAQLAGYISEHSAYHHGEASLTQTVIGMAQNFIGSNNINLLSPCGQFGTRLMGGKDAASPRYVFTKLENITRCIFHPHDDPLLTYLDDDGQSIEPSYYVPVIPMVLVNGSEGIGTGWSSSVPTYNPRDVISNLRRMITGELAELMVPWYRGFEGEIMAKVGKDTQNYVVSGKVEQIDESTIVISELPVGRWTTDYKQMLEGLIIGAAPTVKEKEDGVAAAPQIIRSFKENHTDTTVLFTVVLPPEKLAEITAEKGGLQKRFKLDSSIATTNMHMFDLNSHIKKFDSVKEIMESFFDVRLNFYNKRKDHLTRKLTDEWDKLDNKVRFILEVISHKLVVSNRKKVDILADLKHRGYKTFCIVKKPDEVSDSSSSEDVSESESETPKEDLGSSYDYLLSMKIWCLTMENVQSLTAERDSKRAELEELRNKTPEDLWLADLDALELALEMFEEEIDASKKLEKVAQRRANAAGKMKRGGKSGKPKGRALNSEDEDDFEDDDSYGVIQKKKAAPVKKVVAAFKPIIKVAALAPIKQAIVVKSVVLNKPVVPIKAALLQKSAQIKVPAKKSEDWDSDEEDEEDDSLGDSDDDDDDDDEEDSISVEEKTNKTAPTKAEGKPKAMPVSIALPSNKVIELLSEDEYEDEPESKVVLKKPADEGLLARLQRRLSGSPADMYKTKAVSAFDFTESSQEGGLKAHKPTKTKGVFGAVAKPNSVDVSKGVKRVKKASADVDVGPSSPNEPTPMAKKKARKEPVEKAADKIGAKKVVRRIDDDDDDDVEVVPANNVTKSSKPARARKPLNYATYFDGDEEEEAEDDIIDSEDDSDFD